MSMQKKDSLQIAVARTGDEDQHLGKWVAQIGGLPQARTYGDTKIEAVGRLVLAFGKEQGMAKVVGRMTLASGKEHGIAFSSDPDSSRVKGDISVKGWRSQ